MKKEDKYLTILRFGKENVEDGVSLESLVNYLNKQGFNVLYHDNFLTNYFHVIFFSKDGNKVYNPNNLSERFFLTPECYMQVLGHDDIVASRKEAKETRWYTIIAILLSFASFLVSIFR